MTAGTGFFAVIYLSPMNFENEIIECNSSAYENNYTYLINFIAKPRFFMGR